MNITHSRIFPEARCQKVLIVLILFKLFQIIPKQDRWILNTQHTKTTWQLCVVPVLVFERKLSLWKALIRTGGTNCDAGQSAEKRFSFVKIFPFFETTFLKNFFKTLLYRHYALLSVAPIDQALSDDEWSLSVKRCVMRASAHFSGRDFIQPKE